MIGLLSDLARVLLILLVVRLLGRFFAGLARSTATVPPVRPRAPAAAVDLVRDRVCNTFLPRARAVTATVAGREEHFCSAACRDSALAGHA